jgi:hypothetical protein
MRVRTQEDQAIEMVLAAIKRVSGAAYRVTRRPDQGNRERSDVDAYAEAEGASVLAIEHTRLETLAGQARDDAWFERGLGPLEGVPLGCPLRLNPPHQNVVPGQDWADIRARIAHWAIERADELPEGLSEHQVPGVPFDLTVEKPPIGEPGIHLGRMEPVGDRDAQLLATMHVALDHKRDALERYRRERASAVLVLESEDVVLTSVQAIYKAFLLAARGRSRPWLDQVWLVRTGAGEQPCCLRGPDELTAVNPPNYFMGRRFEETWLRDSERPRRDRGS